MKNLALTLLTSIFFTSVYSQVTFSKDVAEIIYNNCTSCHRTGEIGPIPFTNYDEVSQWGEMIKYVTEINYMPPWPPNGEYRHLLNERILTSEEKDIIKEWVDNGMPQGIPEDEPDIPSFPSGSQIGTPDIVLEMAESYTIAGNNQDDYRVFVIPSEFFEDKEIAAIEFRPGNKRAVHHALIATDITGTAKQLDAQSPGYGYYAFGDFGFPEADMMSWGYVPGNKPLIYPEGIGETIPAGADILIQIHYAPLPSEETDLSSINIFFKKEADPITREVLTGWVTPLNLPGGWFSFQIPPDEIVEFKAESFFEQNSNLPGANFDVSLIGVTPHAHLLGKSYKIYAVSPQNDTIPIIHIPEYDFNWQGAYTLERMLKIPANSDWYTEAIYDNTEDNPSNPNTPPKLVTWGEGTKDEMLVTFLNYVPYKEGDEDIDLGDISTSIIKVDPTTRSTFYPLFPNPSTDQIKVSFHLEDSEELFFEIFSIQGQKIMDLSTKSQWPNGFHNITTQIDQLNSGDYLVRMSGKNYQLNQRFVKI